jgi:hypothetical protein
MAAERLPGNRADRPKRGAGYIAGPGRSRGSAPGGCSLPAASALELSLRMIAKLGADQVGPARHRPRADRAGAVRTSRGRPDDLENWQAEYDRAEAVVRSRLIGKPDQQAEALQGIRSAFWSLIAGAPRGPADLP